MTDHLKVKLNPTDISSVIDRVDYHREPGSTFTICTITLKNGHKVVGQNACIAGRVWNEDMAKEASYNQALDKVWELEAYLLRQRLYEADMAHLFEVPEEEA